MTSSYIRKRNRKYTSTVASNRLRHSTINITMDLYSHVLKDMNEDAADRLNEVIYK